MKRSRQQSLAEFGVSPMVSRGYKSPYIPKKSTQTTLDRNRHALECATVGIVGSRSFVDEERGVRIMRNFVDWLSRDRSIIIDRVASGGAVGVDSIAVAFAKTEDIPCTEFLPDSAVRSPDRYYQRNQLIVDASDILLAVWDEESRGTLDTVKRAKRKGIPVFVYNFKNPGLFWEEYVPKKEERKKLRKKEVKK